MTPDRFREGVVYKIENSVDGKVYIGMTTRSVKERWAEHCKKSSNCRYLANAIKKYGAEAFTFSEIAWCDSSENLAEVEMLMILAHNSIVPNGYNLTSGGENTKPSDETRRKISASNMGKKPSQETKAKMSLAKKGKPLSLEHSHKISSALKGRIHSEEARRKMSLSQTGKVISSEARAKISDSLRGKPGRNTGHKHSEEAKAKISKASKGRIVSEETRMKFRIATSGEKNPFYGRSHSEETKQKISHKRCGIPWSSARREAQNRRARNFSR